MSNPTMNAEVDDEVEEPVIEAEEATGDQTKTRHLAPIRFVDSMDRSFIFPFHEAKSWTSVRFCWDSITTYLLLMPLFPFPSC